MKIVIVTSNKGKLREMRGLFADMPWDILSLADFPRLQMPPENGATMQENARIKAVHCATELQLPCLADDSGLEVDALGGEPGVHSARWHPGTDQDRSAALLARLQNVPQSRRGARFRCTLCLAWDPENLVEADGVCEGAIAPAPRGENGFGYDPIFEITDKTEASPELIGKTMAEISALEKAQLSHRARAAKDLIFRL